MAYLDSQDAKEQIRQAVDIVDLVGSYVALRRQGRGYVGLCPWHDDSRPSFQVNPERQSYKCWVCDVGGDVFSFVMKAEGVEFREALEMLAERAGIELTRGKPGGGNDAADADPFAKQNLLRVMAWAEEQFHRCLLRDPAAEPARRYLAERGISEASVAQFRLGFAPQQWSWILELGGAAGFSPPVLERVGLVIRNEAGRYYDRYRGRTIFSIRDVRSRPIAFGGRVIPELVSDDDPNAGGAKYINSPETPLFSKSSQLYALDLARDAVREEGGLLVMEGYTDVIMAHQHGVKHAVAVLGTALGDKHIPLVRRFTDSLTLVLDGDAAGQNRTMDILDNLLALFVENEVELKILSLPTGGDPCDVILSQGSEAFRRLLSTAVDALEHKINAVTNGLATAPSAHRSAQAVEAILATLARALPQTAPSSAALLRQEQVVARVARQFGVAADSLRDRLKAIRRDQRKRLASVRASDAAPPETESAAGDLVRASATAWDREVLELLLHHPHTATELFAHIAAEDFASEAARIAYAAIAALDAEGELLAYDRWMLALDDVDAKNLLVDCDERGSGKAGSDVQLRVRGVLADLERRRREPEDERQLAQFRQKAFLDSTQEDQALLDYYRRLGGKSN